MLPVAPTSGALQPLGLDEVRLAPGFWGDRRELVATATLPHCLDWIERVGWLDNFRGAPHRGRVFADSEVYKVAEAMAWSGRHEARLGDLAEVLASAQEPDGYPNTARAANRYADPVWGHELYCTGHLIAAGVAELRTAGEGRLTEVARAAADHVCEEFGPTGRDAVCGHPGIEMALVELYRATGERRYLEQARRFLDRRGRGVLRDGLFDTRYFLDDVGVRDATVFRGHAVRALYLACAAVDVAVETGDGELLDAVVRQWDRTVEARTHLTGGMGSRHADEAFGDDFELPEHAYAETCAGVASVMLAWRLLLATGAPRFADLAERTLYNVVAGALGPDGRSFFYANPLAQSATDDLTEPVVPSPRPATARRAPWFEVACCPTNLARLFASLGGYLASRDALGVQLHQLTPCAIGTTLPGGRAVGLSVRTSYPWSGAVTVRVEAGDERPWRLAVRVPAWADGAVLTVAGRRTVVGPGYTGADRVWRPGDELLLELPVRARWTTPDPRLADLRGRIAVEFGPLVYCAEPAGDSVVDPATAPVPGAAPGLGEEVLGLRVAGADLVPYALRACRGPTSMRVWLRSATGPVLERPR